MAITTETIRDRKNGANGAQVITFTSGVTGQKEDIDHTTSYVSTDRVAYSRETGGTAGVSTLTYLGMKILNTDPDPPSTTIKDIIMRGGMIPRPR